MVHPYCTFKVMYQRPAILVIRKISFLSGMCGVIILTSTPLSAASLSALISSWSQMRYADFPVYHSDLPVIPVIMDSGKDGLEFIYFWLLHIRQ